MGRLFIEHMGGARVVECKKCLAPLTNGDHLESGDFRGSSGKAYLYSKAVNLNYGHVQQRNMTTGTHFVRDVYCKVCGEKIGWVYEFAVPKDQRHKEGKLILEKSYIKESRYPMQS